MSIANDLCLSMAIWLEYGLKRFPDSGRAGFGGIGAVQKQRWPHFSLMTPLRPSGQVSGRLRWLESCRAFVSEGQIRIEERNPNLSGGGHYRTSQ